MNYLLFQVKLKWRDGEDSCCLKMVADDPKHIIKFMAQEKNQSIQEQFNVLTIGGAVDGINKEVSFNMSQHFGVPFSFFLQLQESKLKQKVAA